MTELTSWIGVTLFVLCVTLILHAAYPRSSNTRKHLKLPWWSLCVRFLLECASFFIWLAWWIPLLAWMFFGEGSLLHKYGWIFAVMVAVSAAGIAAVRIQRNGATARYLRLHLWLSIVLILSFGAVVVYESVRTIKGMTPDSAARNVFVRLTAHMDEPVSYVEQVGRSPHGVDRQRYRSYWILGAKEPRGRFTICRHKWYGWKYASGAIFRPSADELSRAKKRLSSSTNRDGAIGILRRIVANYPNTPAETEARELLESLGEPAPPR